MAGIIASLLANPAVQATLAVPEVALSIVSGGISSGLANLRYGGKPSKENDALAAAGTYQPKTALAQNIMGKVAEFGESETGQELTHVLQGTTRMNVPFTSARLKQSVTSRYRAEDIPLTKGQSLGDLEKLQRENYLRAHPETAAKAMEFDQLQAQAVKEYAGSLFKKVDTPAAGQRAIAAFTGLLKKMKGDDAALGTAEFESAKAAGGGKAVISMKPVAEKLMEMIEKAVAVGSPESMDRAAKLQREFDSMTVEVSPGRYAFTKKRIEDMRSYLQEKTAQAYQPRNDAVSLSEHDAKEILRAAKDTTQDAADKGNLGAQKLVAARAAHADRARAINKYENNTLNHFLLDEGKDSTPEAVMRKLDKMDDTQRREFVAVAAQTDPALIDDLRNYKLTKLAESGDKAAAGASNLSPQYSNKTLVKSWDKMPEDEKAFLFPDNAKRANVEATMNDIRRTYGDVPIAEEAKVNKAAVAGFVAGTAAGAPATGTMVGRGTGNFLKNLRQNPVTAFEDLYNNGGGGLTNAANRTVTNMNPVVASAAVSGRQGPTQDANNKAAQSAASVPTAGVVAPAMNPSVSVAGQPGDDLPDLPDLPELSQPAEVSSMPVAGAPGEDLPDLPDLPGTSESEKAWEAKTKQEMNDPFMPVTQDAATIKRQNIESIQQELKMTADPKTKEILLQELKKNALE